MSANLQIVVSQETGILYEKNSNHKLQIVVREGPRPLYEKVDGKAHR